MPDPHPPLVAAAQIADVAATWDAPVSRYVGAEALAIVAALRSPDLPDDATPDALLPFEAEGRVRIFFMQAGCVRAFLFATPARWDEALRQAFGEPT
jgi:hypothetical protein